MLTKHRTVFITRTITWQRVSPNPPVPAQTNDSLPMEDGGSIADDESTSDRGGGGGVEELVYELDDDLAHLNNLDVTWGFDLDVFCTSADSRPPAAGDAGDGKVETIGSSQRGAVDASSVPTGRAKARRSVRFKGDWFV